MGLSPCLGVRVLLLPGLVPTMVGLAGSGFSGELFCWQSSNCLGSVPVFTLLSTPLQIKEIWVFMLPDLYKMCFCSLCS